MVDFEKVRIFYHVMHKGNLNDACKILKKSPGTVSKHLSDLESTLNQKLYIRRHGRLEMTAEGRALFSVAQNTIPSLESALSRYESPSDDGETVTILTTTGITGIWLMGRLKEFFARNPGVFVRVITTNESADFKNSKADVAILPNVHNADGLTQRKILTVSSGLFASQDYLDQHGTPTCLSDLDQNHHFIGYYSDIKVIRGDVDWHLTRGTNTQGERPCRLFVNLGFYQMEAARLGLGIVAMADVDDFLVHEGLVRLLPAEDLKVDVYLFSRQAELQREIVKNFVNFIASPS